MIKSFIKRSFNRIGLDVSYAASMTARQRKLVSWINPSAVLDVGANVGGFASEFRALGYDGPILSFEPLSTAWTALCRAASSDDKWQVFNWALGEDEGERTINVSGNLVSSSFLQMLDAHVRAVPASAYTSKESVRIRRLDQVLPDLDCPKENLMLKIDTQGFERSVLNGASGVMQMISSVKIELSLVAMYMGSPTMNEMTKFMSSNGFTAVDFQPGLADPTTGQLLQMDGLFRRM